MTEIAFLWQVCEFQALPFALSPDTDGVRAGRLPQRPSPEASSSSGLGGCREQQALCPHPNWVPVSGSLLTSDVPWASPAQHLSFPIYRMGRESQAWGGGGRNGAVTQETVVLSMVVPSKQRAGKEGTATEDATPLL